MPAIRRFSSFRAVAFIIALVLAQSAALAHVGFDDSHPAGEPCAFCVGLSTLTAGNICAPSAVEPIDRRTTDLPYSPLSFHGRAADRHHARDPPIAS